VYEPAHAILWKSFSRVTKAELCSGVLKAMSENVRCHQLIAADQSAPMHWYAVYTVTRHEKRVAQLLNLQAIENFLPLYQKQCNWRDGSKVMLQLPLFSSYLFVRINRASRVPVLQVSGVRSIIGFGSQLSPVPDSYIDWLRESLLQRKIEPHPHLPVGSKVRIRSGAMAGIEGILIRVKNDYRVVLTMEMINRSVAVEVTLKDIEPVSLNCFPCTAVQTSSAVDLDRSIAY
jgi:transcription antitermination factor NusG